jgi:hypothetical protein
MEESHSLRSGKVGERVKDHQKVILIKFCSLDVDVMLFQLRLEKLSA